jgi:hypothetical protein
MLWSGIAFTGLIALLVGSSATAVPPTWQSIGPRPITNGQVEAIDEREVDGAIECIAPHPTDKNTVYVGAVNGGVWMTRNATAPHPHWDPLPIAANSIRALEFDPTDEKSQTLIAGVGHLSSFGGGGPLLGIFRTTHGGTNWTEVNGTGGPAGLNVTGVAARGPILLAATLEKGILRSRNGGQKWEPVSGSGKSHLPPGSVFDLASDPSDSERLYAIAGMSGVFRSDNTGETWNKVSTAVVDDALPGLVNAKLAVGPGHVVFAAIGGACGGPNGNRCVLSGLFRSNEANNAWAALDIPTTMEQGVPIGIHPGGQASLHLSLVADPTSSSIVYVGGDRQPSANEGTDQDGPTVFPNSIGAMDFSGRVFRVDASKLPSQQATPLTHSGTKSNSAPHADSRAMRFSPDGSLIAANDGGIYRRTDPRTAKGDWLSMNGDIEVTELHAIGWDSVAKIAIGGAQDTGIPQQAVANSYPWDSLDEGDGAEIAVDSTSSPQHSIRYSSTENLLNFLRSVYDDKNNWISSVEPQLLPLDGAPPIDAQFYTPLKLNATQPLRLILGGQNSVYESIDQGDSISEVGAKVVANGSTTIAYGAADNPDVLYVGAVQQLFARTAAPPATLTPLTTFPGTGVITGVAVDPAKFKVAVVVEGNALWDAPTYARRVWMTTDAGQHFVPITGNLPTLCPGYLMAAAVIRQGNDRIVVVGCDMGVFYSTSPTFTTWAPLGTGLPPVPVVSFDFSTADGRLTIATLGRGAWAIDLPRHL